MWLLKTHSHTSERRGYEARKNAKTNNRRKRRHYNKANHPSKPAAYRQCGGGDEAKKALWQDKPLSKTLSRTVSVAGGGETKKSELKENTGANTRGTKIKTLPQKPSRRLPSWPGGETKGENQHEMERWHNPQSREGGEVPSRKRIADKKQDNVHRKEK